MISHEYIVTAAHCFDKAEHGKIHEKIVNLKCGTRNNKIHLTPIHIVNHPEWDESTHDIAVIQINKVEYSTTLRPACVISREELLRDSKLTVVGTGEGCK